MEGGKEKKTKPSKTKTNKKNKNTTQTFFRLCKTDNCSNHTFQQIMQTSMEIEHRKALKPAADFIFQQLFC